MGTVTWASISSIADQITFSFFSNLCFCTISPRSTSERSQSWLENWLVSEEIKTFFFTIGSYTFIRL